MRVGFGGHDEGARGARQGDDLGIQEFAAVSLVKRKSNRTRMRISNSFILKRTITNKRRNLRMIYEILKCRLYEKFLVNSLRSLAGSPRTVARPNPLESRPSSHQ